MGTTSLLAYHTVALPATLSKKETGMNQILRVLADGMKGLWSFGRTAASSQHGAEDDQFMPFRPSIEIRLLAITASAREENKIRVIAATHGWTLLVADSVRSALTILEVESAPLIFYDRDLPGIEWPNMFQILLSVQEQCCIILVSPVTDDYLWRAVIERGGYDVLTKPLQEDRFISMVRLAWLYQKTGWVQHPARPVRH